MEDSGYRSYGYRWVVLGMYALVTIVIEMQWLSFAPIAREAKAAYGVDAMGIDLLSMIFMGVFLVMCLPASYVIDTRGLRAGIGLGAALTGIFSLVKGIFADSYAMVVAAQVGLAVAQPFILNASTKLAGRWFPVNERATAVGVSILAQFVGIILVMGLTPPLVGAGGGIAAIKKVLLLYGVISAAGAALALVLIRERPPSPAGPGGETTDEPFFKSLAALLKNRDMALCLVMFFAGLGLFNAVSICIDQICELKGFSMEQSGAVGGAMLIAGIAGAIILPPLSDRTRRRKPFLVAGMALMTPGLVGLAFSNDYAIVLASSAVLGFFLLGAGAPVGFQYVAEATHPAPESASQGTLLLAGQLSGILFIIGMNYLGMTPFMYFFIALAALNVVLCLMLRESKLILTS